MSEDQRPRDDPEPTRLDSADLEGDANATREGGGTPDDGPTAKRLGDFDLLREIGRGGMGVVYEARQISLKRRVALKVLPPALGMSAQAKQRFEREAQAAAKLHHTNIVPVHAIGEHEGHHFYAMDLIEGQSLDHVLRDMVDEGSNPLVETAVTQTTTELRPQRAERSSQDQATTSLSDTSAGGREWFDTVAKLMAEVADGLHYAHGRGVIHRDVKPANLMLSREGHLSITDFGLARLLEEPGMTVSGSFLGTPAYMAPEQIAAGRINVDHRADIYSLGAVLYEMLTMQRPFGGQSREQVLAAVMTKDPRPPRRFNGKIPVDLETICLKALEKDVDRRYATAGEMAQDLRQYLQGGLITARRAGPIRRTVKSIRRHPGIATAVTAAVLIALVGAIAWKALAQRNLQQAERAISDARYCLDQGEYRKGLEKTDEALSLRPGSLEARVIRARLLMGQHRYQQAADEAQTLLASNANDWTAHLILAVAATKGLLSGITTDEHLEAVSMNAPKTAEAYYLRAVMADSDRQAVELLHSALALEPAHASAVFERISRHVALKDFPAAMADAERLALVRPRSAQGPRAAAWIHWKQYDYDRALAAIERAIVLDPDDAMNYLMRARVHCRSDPEPQLDTIFLGGDDFERCLEDLARAIELDPETATPYYHRAEVHNDAGQFEEAIADARRAIGLQSDHPLAYRPLLEAQLSLSREKALRTTLEELRTAADGWADPAARARAYREIADYHRRLKDYDRGLAAANRIIEIEPDRHWGFIWRARIRRELQDMEGFRADCEAAANLDLESPDDLSARGASLINHCDMFERAHELLDELVERFPTWYLPYFYRGTSHYFQRRFEEALVDLTQAIELAPQYAYTYVNRAVVYYELQRGKESTADYRRALELNPYNPQGHANYADVCFNDGRLEDALHHAEKAIELDPFNALGHINHGMVLSYLERCEEAASEFRKAVELRPDGSSAVLAWAHLFNFYYTCPDHYDLTEALRHAQSAYEARPERERETLAMALFRKGDYAEVKRIGLVLFDEDSKRTWFPLVITFWHLGEKTEARKFYDRSVTWMDEHQPNNPRLIRQRQEAAELLGIQP
jgi:serine/threonine protein kinase/Tfp pilus assembly protein PilF